MPLSTTQRIQLLAQHSHLFEKWTSSFDAPALTNWLEKELGTSQLESLKHNPHPLIPETILHILSANTPHAAHQSLLRGLLLGSHNLLKLPRTGSPELQETLHQLPTELSQLIETHPSATANLPELIDRSELVVAYGSDPSLLEIRQLTPLNKPFLAHGTRLSIALISEMPDAQTLQHLAHAIGHQNQQGCLSLQSLYVIESDNFNHQTLTQALLPHMADYEKKHPRGPLSLSESGAISNLRLTTQYRAANNPQNIQLHQSSETNTHWTLITNTDPTLTPSTLNRLAYLHPFPINNSVQSLGSELQHLSTVLLHPYTDELKQTALALKPHRICRPENLHTPPLTWHHDGLPPLASLVKWITLD